MRKRPLPLLDPSLGPQVCLHPLLRAAHSSVALAAALQRLPIGGVVLLLGYLERWLQVLRRRRRRYRTLPEGTPPGMIHPSRHQVRCCTAGCPRRPAPRMLLLVGPPRCALFYVVGCTSTVCQSVGRPASRPVGRSVGRSEGRTVGWSVGRSVCRSVLCTLYRLAIQGRWGTPSFAGNGISGTNPPRSYLAHF